MLEVLATRSLSARMRSFAVREAPNAHNEESPNNGEHELVEMDRRGAYPNTREHHYLAWKIACENLAPLTHMSCGFAGSGLRKRTHEKSAIKTHYHTR